MLSNAYFLAKFRFDAAENEPAKNLQNFANFPNFANPNPQRDGRSAALRHADGVEEVRRVHDPILLLAPWKKTCGW